MLAPIVRGFAASLALAISVSGSCQAHEITTSPSCIDGLVTIASVDEYETELICRGVTAAVVVLSRCGLTTVPRVTVETTLNVIDENGFSRRGEFVRSSNLIRIHPYGHFIATNRPSLAATRMSHATLYASIASHEMAHAMIAEARPILDLVPTAHEYIAYAVQIETLPTAIRDTLAVTAKPSVRADLLMFSPFLLYADPEQFAATAWRHFSQPHNGCRFLLDILSGQVHFPPPSD